MSTADSVLRVVRSGLGGIVVGTVTAAAGDYAVNLVMGNIQKPKIITNAGALANMAVGAVVSGAAGAVILYAGDSLFERFVGDEFLAHMIFFQTFFFQSGTIRGASHQLRAMLNGVSNMDSLITTGNLKSLSKPPAASTAAPTGSPAPVPGPGETPIQEMFATKSNKACSRNGCGLFL